MSTATLASPAVTAFAAAVRAALADLPEDEVDELTDGLEADLTERIADGGVEGGDLGDPVRYAEELRVAAGLPNLAPRRARSYWVRIPVLVAAEWRALVGRYPLLSQIAQFLVSLRPVWWIFRAAAVTWVLLILFGGYLFAPISGPFVLLFVAMVVLSVQFGRGKWLPFAWMRGLLLAGNILLAISVPFVLAGVVTSINNTAYAAADSNQPTSESSGLQLDGAQVSNVFAYDAQGNPLSQVQLFDQDGKPLNLVGDPLATADQEFSPRIIVPNQSVSGRLGWN
ncbi:MAG: hypothetical protein M3N46_02545, partial [Actinomycetota bacterium]|nr:hypothetical protein [Actinomycetota bacterium]